MHLTNIGPEVRRGVVVAGDQASSVDKDNDGLGRGARVDRLVHIDAMSGVRAVFEGLVCLELALVLLAVLGLERLVEVDEDGRDVVVPLGADVDNGFSGGVHIAGERRCVHGKAMAMTGEQ